ncbi:hypothetical protein WDU94_009262 [Cyamophila willieti]
MAFSNLFNYKYLDKHHLNGFEKYKYSSIDTNPIGIYLMHPFWNKLVEYFPRWLAPNLITFVGFLFTVLSFVLLSIFDYNYYASSLTHPDYPPLPKWIFTLVGIYIFLAYTLDGIDGKQARRTGTAGPVGELFDHGLDSWTAMFVPALLYSIFGRSDFSVSPLRMYLICWNVFIAFYASHWEKYNTGVLYLPWSYDLSMIGTTIVFLFTGVYGFEFWKVYLYGEVTLGILLELTFYVSSFVSNLPVVIYNVYHSYQTGTGKNRPLLEALRPLFPLFSFIVLSFYWVKTSPNDVMTLDPRAVFISTGTIFSNICCRLIVAQMSNTRCDAFNWLLVAQGVTIVLSSFFVDMPVAELCLLYLFGLVAVLAHVHYGACVVRQMCKHFKIKVFKIKSK